jgi:hypothetical protein
MMTCREAVRLMSEEMDRELAGGQRFALRLHTLICLGCHRYRQQMSFLRQACRREVPADDPTRPPA